MDCSLPGSCDHGLLQARVVDWIAISFSRRSSQPRDQTQVFHIAGRCFIIWATRKAILYIEFPKDSNRKLLELISEFSKVARYKINTQKSLAFLYTNNEKSEREIKESVPFTIAKEIIKYLGINLPKETKELYTENYDTDERNQR